MHADCLAVVDGQRGTYWTAAVTCTSVHAAQSLEAVEQAHPGRSLQLIKSYTNRLGAEVFIELMTPWARKTLDALKAGLPKPARAVVEVWQANTPTFGFGPQSDELRTADFTRCADILVPHTADNPHRSLDCAFGASQNIDEAWRVGWPCRSTSVGDVLVLSTAEGRTAYRIDNVGFSEVVFGTDSPAPKVSSD